jgi:hypothetical protein
MAEPPLRALGVVSATLILVFGGGSITLYRPLGVAKPPPDWLFRVVKTTTGQARVAEPPSRALGTVSATPILFFGDGRTISKGLGGGSATPDRLLGVAESFILQFFFKLFFNIYIFSIFNFLIVFIIYDAYDM